MLIVEFSGLITLLTVFSEDMFFDIDFLCVYLSSGVRYLSCADVTPMLCVYLAYPTGLALFTVILIKKSKGSYCTSFLLPICVQIYLV